MNSKGAYEGIQRGRTYFEDGLRKRALDVNVNRNKGLLTSTGAHILQREPIM